MTEGLKRLNREVVEEVPYGMYVWELPSGEILGDGDGNVMNVFCMKSNQLAIEALTRAAKSYGFADGKAVWWSGKRPITDEEYEEQLARARWGMVPDPLDYGAIREEELARRNGH
jgi:hypothetical protein